MKIALINPWYITENSMGGTERFVDDLAISLSKDNNFIDVYMLSGKSYKKDNINFISINLFGENTIVDEYILMEKFGTLENKDTYIKIAKEIEKYIDPDKYDVIQLNSHFFLKLFSGKKRIFTIHSNLGEFEVLWTKKEFEIMVKVMKEEIKNNMIYVCPSNYYKKEWDKILNHSISYIPHALNRDRLKCNTDKNVLLKKYNLNSDKIKILLPSRLEKIQKQPKLILEALSLMPEDKKNKFQIIFTGIDDQYKKYAYELENYSKANRIDSKFIIFDSIKEGYKITDLVLIPSRSESFGYSCLESISLGIPTIINNIPTLKEISKGIENSFVFDNTKEELYNVLLSILTINYKERRNISEKWLFKYDLNSFGKRYISLIYDSIR